MFGLVVEFIEIQKVSGSSLRNREEHHKEMKKSLLCVIFLEQQALSAHRFVGILETEGWCRKKKKKKCLKIRLCIF